MNINYLVLTVVLILSARLVAADVCVIEVHGLSTQTLVQASINDTEQRILDPQYGFGDKWDMVDAREREISMLDREHDKHSLNVKKAELNLVSGNVSAFLAQTRLLQEQGLDKSPWSDLVTSQKILRLYSLAVEGGVDRIDAFGTKKLIKMAGATPEQFERWEESEFDSSGELRGVVAFLRSDFLTLNKIVDTQKSDSETSFRHGVLSLWAAKLSQDPGRTQYAIDVLTKLEKTLVPQTACESLMHGRVALQLAEAHLIALSLKSDVSDHVRSASRFSRLARQKLELSAIPLLWGRAHGLSAEVEEILWVAERNPERKELLRVMIDQLELASMRYN